jgi:hypothetical protein
VDNTSVFVLIIHCISKIVNLILEIGLFILDVKCDLSILYEEFTKTIDSVLYSRLVSKRLVSL